MATRTGVSPRAPSYSYDRIPFRLRATRVLFVLCIMLGVVSAVHAQSPPQQYVYGSQQLTTTSSVITGFGKNGVTGALIPVPGSPANERLEGGRVAIDGQGKFLFVLNPQSNDISMFQIDQTTGALTEVLASPFAVPPTLNPSHAPTQPMSIATEKSGKFVFVGYYDGDILGLSSVVSLTIDTSGSSPILVTQQSTYLPSGGAPYQLLADPKGLRLYVGMRDGQNHQPTGETDVYSIDPLTGALSFVGIANVGAGRGRTIAMDPQGRFLFAGWGQNIGFIDSCILSPVDGTARLPSSTINLGPNPGNNPVAMLVDSSGMFLYMVQSAVGVVVYSIDQNTAALTQVQGPLANISFFSAVADPVGPYIYSLEVAGIVAYQIDQQSGNLTAIPGSPFSDGSSGVVGISGIAISGNPVQAVSGPVATIFPTTAATFGAILGSSSATQVFSIVNIGDRTLSINSIAIIGTNASSFSQTNTCAPTLPPNANCSVSINFTPPSVGAFTATLQVADNAPGSPHTLALNGTGFAAVPAIAFSPAVPSFPTITQGTSSAPQTLAVNSTGNTLLHISSVSLGGPNPSDFSFTNNCTAPVAPSANCTISLVFNPIAPGQRTANLLISDDVAGSPQTVLLSATANPAFSSGAAPGGSTVASVSAGQTAQFQMQLTPGPGFSGSVSFTCSGAPLGATCHVPSSVPVANGAPAPFTVSVSTSGAALLPPLIPVQFTPFERLRLLPLLALALVLFLVLANRRVLENTPHAKSMAWNGAFLAIVFCAALSIGGCGAESSSSVMPPPVITPSGTSTIIITPTAMSSSGKPLQLQPIQLTLTVK